MSEFLTELDARLLDDDRIWLILAPLIYRSGMLGKITVPAGFQTDFASVPRVPIFYRLYGDRAHRESVIHDYLYRIDSKPCAGFDIANLVFLEAMVCRGKPRLTRCGMYRGVCLGGKARYHELFVGDSLCPVRPITT